MCLLLAGIKLYNVERHSDLELVRQVRNWEKREDEDMLASLQQARREEQKEVYHTSRARALLDGFKSYQQQLEEGAEDDRVSSSPLTLSLSSFSRSLSLFLSLSISFSLSLSLSSLPAFSTFPTTV